MLAVSALPPHDQGEPTARLAHWGEAQVRVEALRVVFSLCTLSLTVVPLRPRPRDVPERATRSMSARPSPQLRASSATCSSYKKTS